MKKILIVLFGAVLLALAIGAIYINPLLPIITGYSAKNLASGVFVSKRTQQSLENEDLNFSFIRFVKNKIDHQNKTVSSSFLWNETTAKYHEGFGCTIYPNNYWEALNLPTLNEALDNSDKLAWPQGNLIADTIPQGIDMNKLRTVADDMFSEQGDKQTFGLMVVYKGQVVLEKYRADFNHKSKFLSWSVAKSIMNGIVGARVAEKKLDIYEPLSIKGVQRNITINNLLQMNSGLEWNENYGNQSDVTIMLHKVNDMALYAWSRELIHEPGQHWCYSSGSSNVVSAALRQSFKSDEEYWRYPKEHFFNKIGMSNTVFELDFAGNFVASSYVYATLRDYARFGLLYLQNGKWEGEQILPQGWVRYTKMVASGSKGEYGSSFWLNANEKMPNTPTDALMCKGHDGQFIIILPSDQLVIVRTGYSPNRTFDADLMIKEIRATVNAQ